MSENDLENQEIKSVEEEIKDAVEDEGVELDDEKQSFPNATVVRLMRKNLDKHKQIKGIVKKKWIFFLAEL